METQTAAEQLQYLTFRLSGDEYAISVLRIKEIIEFDHVTRVPRMPRWIRGVINLRGKVIPVVDLSVKFGLDETKITKLACIIIVEVELQGEPVVMGVIAESVSQIVDLASDAIQPPPAFGTHIRAEFLAGMGSVGKQLALLLDIDHILSTDELLVASSSEEGALQGSINVAASAAHGLEEANARSK